MMDAITPTSDEVLAVVRELFPREYEIAALTVLSRRQAERIAQLEGEATAPSP